MARKPESPSQDNMEFTVDFKEDLGIDFDLNNLTKQQIGDLITDQIRSRTRDEKRPLEGSSFAPYSEKYAQRKGVDVNNVDLTLFRDMLDSVTVTEVTQNGVTIGFDSSVEIPKAFNHHTGDTVPERPFFGIEEGELEQIKGELGEQIRNQDIQDKERKRVQEETEKAKKDVIEEIADEFVRELFDFG